MYCAVGRCTVCYGGALCVMAEYYHVMVVVCVVGRCTVVCYGGELYVMLVYCMLGHRTVCYGGVLCGRSVYCVLWRCTVW